MMDDLIIACVQNLPLLWDKKHPNYRNILKKQNAWTIIAAQLNISVEEVQARFKALRQKYRREKAIEDSKSKSGAARDTRKKWELFSSMQFLEESSSVRSTTSNMDDQTEYSDFFNYQEETDPELETEHVESYYDIDQDDNEDVNEDTGVFESSDIVHVVETIHNYSNSKDLPLKERLKMTGKTCNKEVQDKLLPTKILPSKNSADKSLISTQTSSSIKKIKQNNKTVDKSIPKLNEVLSDITTAVKNISQPIAEEVETRSAHERRIRKFCDYLAEELITLPEDACDAIFNETICKIMTKKRQKIC